MSRNSTERWPSGRRRLIGIQVYGNPVSWVRIPPSPPDKERTPCGSFFCLEGVCGRSRRGSSRARRSRATDARSAPAGRAPKVRINPTLSARQRKDPLRVLFLSRGGVRTKRPGFESSTAEPGDRRAKRARRESAEGANQSHPLRQTKKGPLAGPFFVSRGCADEAAGVRVEHGGAGRQTREARPQGERRRCESIPPSPPVDRRRARCGPSFCLPVKGVRANHTGFERRPDQRPTGGGAKPGSRQRTCGSPIFSTCRNASL